MENIAVRKIAAFFVVAALTCGFGWLAGFDFDRRGFPAFMMAYAAFAAGALAAWIIP